MTLSSSEYVPAWKIVMIISFVGALVFGVFAVRDWIQGEETSKAEPNLRLAVLVKNRLPGGPFMGDDVPEGRFTELSSLFHEIRQSARLGKLTVWGRKDSPIGQERIPLSDVPPDFWEHGEIDILGYLRGGEHERGTATLDPFKGKTEYTDLRLNSRQVRHAIPRYRWPKITFAMPFKLEKRS